MGVVEPLRTASRQDGWGGGYGLLNGVLRLRVVFA